MITITPQELIEAAQEVARTYPDARLVKNDVGNLAIYQATEYVGFISLASASVTYFE
jgi:hypothetical protein